MAALGNLVRLLPLHINELPAHPALDSLLQNPSSNGESASSSPSHNDKVDPLERPNLISFMEEILDQAVLFVDETLPATFKEGELKKSEPSAAKVQLWKRMIPPAEIEAVRWINSSIPRNWSANGAKKPGEAWFARRSRHANHSQEGTADLDEFDYGIRYNHSKHEQDYTPDVFDSYKVLDWSEQIEAAIGKGPGIDNYRELNMSIYEMCHQLPAVLTNRVFPVLVLTAKRGRHAFVVVQIPIDIRNLAAAFYSNQRNRKEGDSSLKRQKVVLGVYTSIETCCMLPDQNIEWTMATASDAKGWLPMWAQKMGVPSAIVKDVGYFIRWAHKKRPNLRVNPLPGSEAENNPSSGG